MTLPQEATLTGLLNNDVTMGHIKHEQIDRHAIHAAQSKIS